MGDLVWGRGPPEEIAFTRRNDPWNPTITSSCSATDASVLRCPAASLVAPVAHPLVTESSLDTCPSPCPNAEIHPRIFDDSSLPHQRA